MPIIHSNLNSKPKFWNRLLNEIETKKLLPIIGNELLEIEIDGKQTAFYQHVSHEVMLALDMDCSDEIPPKSLAEVAYRYMDPMEVYHTAHEIINEREWPIPKALLKLAEITDFDLYVTLTPECLMAKALDKVRFAKQQTTKVLSYSPQTQLIDLPDAYGKDNETIPTVFKLFGDINMRPDYVITEEDVLDFIHHLQVQDLRPTNLFDILGNRSLALMGCSFENWLTRFFFFTTRNNDLFSTKGARGVIADQKTKTDNPLHPFLERNHTLLFTEGDAIDFVNELHRRWKERNSKIQISNQAKTKKQDAEIISVFVSYATEDRQAAERAKKALQQQGIVVWMDQEKLEGGDNFKQEIEKNIKKCKAFIPIISKNTITVTEERFFRKEWNCAIDVSKGWPVSYPFIHPLVIDDTSITNEYIPSEFSDRHQHYCANGNVGEDFAIKLIRSLRRHLNRVN